MQEPWSCLKEEEKPNEISLKYPVVGEKLTRVIGEEPESGVSTINSNHIPKAAF